MAKLAEDRDPVTQHDSAGPQRFAHVRAFFEAALAANYPSIRFMRRLGLVTMLATTGAYGVSSTIMPSILTWYGGRSLVVLLIPAAVAAWALWVILASNRPHATESAG